MQTNFIIKNKNPRIKSFGDNITSHHTMGAFFSGQDMKMVQQEGDDTNCFVSLVVDTRGSYVAIVTRKVQIKKEISVTDIDKSYQFFGEGNVRLECSDQKDTKTLEKQVIEYFDLEIDRHEVNDLGNTEDLRHLDARFDEINAKKEELRRVRSQQIGHLWGDWGTDDFLEGFHKTRYSNAKVQDSQDMALCEPLDIDWTPDPKKIHLAVARMLTCTLLMNYANIDLKQWVMRHMHNMYAKMFGKDCLREVYEDAPGAFCNWRDFIVQHTLDFFSYPDTPDTWDADVDLMMSKVAQAITDELREYVSLGMNYEKTDPFIMSYIDTLSCYII